MRKTIAAGLIACFALLNQSCKKNEMAANGKSEASSKLKVHDTFIQGTVPTGSYKIVTYITYNTTNRALGIDLTSYNAGALVKQLNYIYNNSKDWRITDLGNGYYSIINAFTGQGLTIGNTDENSSVIQYPYGGPDNQQWKVEYQGYGVYRIRAKQNNAKGLHVAPSSTAHGATIKIQTYGTPNQGEGYFLLSPVTVTYQDQAATNHFKRTTGITATDGAASFKLSDGRVFWSSGDSHYNDYSGGWVNCLFNRRSVSWVQPSTTNWSTSNTLPGATNAGFYLAPGSTFSWPAAGFQIGSTAYVYLLPNGQTTNAYFARVNTGTLAVSGYTQITNLGGVSFGNSFIKGGDGYIYAYGFKPIPPYNIGVDLLVARFAETTPIPTTWTFWNGSSWVSNVTQAASLAQLESNSFSVCKINSKYVITCSEFSLGCDGGSKIYAYTSVSNSPTSTFNAKKVIYTIPDRNDGHIPFFYLPLAHPEFNANNELLVIYSINGYGQFGGGTPCVETCVNGKMDPNVTYRPRGIRVPYSVIDPAL